jgi:hypothetical protein
VVAQRVVIQVTAEDVTLGPTAVLVDALLLAARLTVTPEEREAFIADYPLLQARAARLYSVGGELEPAVDFNPAEFYGEEPA